MKFNTAILVLVALIASITAEKLKGHEESSPNSQLEQKTNNDDLHKESESGDVGSGLRRSRSAAARFFQKPGSSSSSSNCCNSQPIILVVPSGNNNNNNGSPTTTTTTTTTSSSSSSTTNTTIGRSDENNNKNSDFIIVEEDDVNNDENVNVNENGNGKLRQNNLQKLRKNGNNMMVVVPPQYLPYFQNSNNAGLSNSNGRKVKLVPLNNKGNLKRKRKNNLN